MSRRWPVLAFAAASLALWFVSCVVWVVLLWVEYVGGCPGLSDSVGADRESWSWVPPGLVCEYDLSGGGTHVDGAPDSRLAVAGLLVVWPLTTVSLTVLGVHAADGGRAPGDGERRPTS